MAKRITFVFIVAVIATILLIAGCGNNPPTSTTGATGSQSILVPPASVSIVVSTATSITLSWTAATGATGYNIYRSTFPNVTVNPGNKINPAPVTQTMAQNTNLLANTTYYYIVTAVSANGESAGSSEVYAKPSTGLVGQTVGGTNTNNNPIIGTVYGTPNPANPLLQIPLLGATVVANNNVTTSDLNGNYSVGTASTVVELSAAAQGYAAQTMAGVPQNTTQNLHLNFLSSPISKTLATSNQQVWGSVLTGSTTVTVTVQAGGVPAANKNIYLYTNNSKVTAAWFPPTNASGVASATVSFYDGVTTANIAVVSYIKAWDTSTWNGTTWVITPGNWSEFGYSITPSQITVAPNGNTNVTVSVVPVTNTLLTISTANMPAATTNSTLGVDIPFANGVHMPFNSTNGWNSAANLSLPINFPNGVPGITQYHAVAYASDPTWTMTGQTFTFASYIGGNYPVGNATLTMPAIPNITSTNSVNSNLPTMIIWNPMPGIVQYQAQIQQTLANTTTYEWDGFTTGTSITKPLFFPSNGGNLVPGYYNLTLIAYPQANVGLGNNYPINPLQAAPLVDNATRNGPVGFVSNPTAPPASSTQPYMDQYWQNYTGQGSMKRLTLTVM